MMPLGLKSLARALCSTTILLVEDEALLRTWLHAALERKGYNLLEAGDGYDALLIAELHEGSIEVVVTDVMMPRLNGPDFVDAVLKLRPCVKVLYISGYPEALLHENSGLPGGVNLLQKPFTVKALVERINNLLTE